MCRKCIVPKDRTTGIVGPSGAQVCDAHYHPWKCLTWKWCHHRQLFPGCGHSELLCTNLSNQLQPTNQLFRPVYLFTTAYLLLHPLVGTQRCPFFPFPLKKSNQLLRAAGWRRRYCVTPSRPGVQGPVTQPHWTELIQDLGLLRVTLLSPSFFLPLQIQGGREDGMSWYVDASQQSIIQPQGQANPAKKSICDIRASVRNASGMISWHSVVRNKNRCYNLQQKYTAGVCYTFMMIKMLKGFS